MKLIALMPVRNEAWIVGISARIALRWCDEIVILDHASTDRTPEILAELSHEQHMRVTLINERRATWAEMDHRQRMLEEARYRGATHIALVDADEVICGDSLGKVRAFAEHLEPGECMNVRMHCPWRSLHQYRVDPCVWSNRRDLALVFRDTQELHWAPRGQYQHHQRAPRGSLPISITHLGVMHLQWVSWRRLIAKHALYKVRERIDYPDKPVHEIDRMYNLALNENNLRVAPCPDEWWSPHSDLMPRMDAESEPWQEAEARRLIAAHGREKFAWLDLFGVA